MEKSNLIKLVALIVVIAVLGGAWWFFGKKNSITSKPNQNSSASNIKSSDKSIASFSFDELGNNESQVVDNANHTVTIVVPNGTSIKKLTPNISTGDSSTISPNSGVAQNFTKPIVYTVTAQDGSTQDYTVTVKIASAGGFGGS